MAFEGTYHVYEIPGHVDVDALLMLLNAVSHEVQDTPEALHDLVPLEELPEQRKLVHPGVRHQDPVFRGVGHLEEQGYLEGGRASARRVRVKEGGEQIKTRIMLISLSDLLKQVDQFWVVILELLAGGHPPQDVDQRQVKLGPETTPFELA